MKSPGRSPHGMLVAFPVALIVTSFIFELFGLAQPAYWTLVAGTVATLVAGPFGLYDLFRLPRDDARHATSRAHLWLGLGVAAVAGLGWYLRAQPAAVSGGLLLLISALGVVAVLATGWIGLQVSWRQAQAEQPAARAAARQKLR